MIHRDPTLYFLLKQFPLGKIYLENRVLYSYVDFLLTVNFPH